MPNVGNRTVRAIEAGDTSPDFKNWVNVQANNGEWKIAKRVFAHNGATWAEVWNNRPVTVTGSGSSSAYDRITVTGTVDPNNFSSTPRFFYKRSSESTYTADLTLTSVTGDGAQSVGSRTITGLIENTTYNYYLMATNDAGTSDQPAIQSVTTPVDCRQLGSANGWSGTTVYTTVNCSDCQSCGSDTKVVTTYTWTKSGCPQYTTTSETACTDGCGTWITTYYHDPYGPPLTVINGALSQYVVWNVLGGGWWYTDANGNPTFGCYDSYGEFGYFGPSSVQYCSVAENTYRVVGPTICVIPMCC